MNPKYSHIKPERHDRIGYFVRVRLQAGDKMEAVVQAAMDKYAVTRATVFTAWKASNGGQVRPITMMGVVHGDAKLFHVLSELNQGNDEPCRRALETLPTWEEDWERIVQEFAELAFGRWGPH